jgi:hypothetical protein
MTTLAQVNEDFDRSTLWRPRGRAIVWAIVNNGRIVPTCIRRTKGAAIRTLVGESPGWQKRWSDLRETSFRVERVEVRLA